MTYVNNTDKWMYDYVRIGIYRSVTQLCVASTITSVGETSKALTCYAAEGIDADVQLANIGIYSAWRKADERTTVARYHQQGNIPVRARHWRRRRSDMIQNGADVYCQVLEIAIIVELLGITQLQFYIVIYCLCCFCWFSLFASLYFSLCRYFCGE